LAFDGIADGSCQIGSLVGSAGCGEAWEGETREVHFLVLQVGCGSYFCQPWVKCGFRLRQSSSVN